MTLDYGKQPYITNKTTYKEYMREVTDQSIKSQGAVYQQAGFKQPYLAKDYQSMMYEFSSPLENLSGLEAPTLDDPFVVITGIESEEVVEHKTITIISNNGIDDGYLQDLSGAYTFNNTDTTIGVFGGGSSYKHHFIRFPNIDIPNGTIIKSAILNYTTAPSAFIVTFHLKINLSDNAVAPVDSTSFLSLQWSAEEVSVVPVTQNTIGTIDVKSLIQQIIDRPNWKSGNAIMFRRHANSAFQTYIYSFDNGSNYPTLKIEV